MVRDLDLHRIRARVVRGRNLVGSPSVIVSVLKDVKRSYTKGFPLVVESMIEPSPLDHWRNATNTRDT